jgi:hypothetical protein
MLQNRTIQMILKLTFSLVAATLLASQNATAFGSLDLWEFRGVFTEGLPTGAYQTGAPYSMRFVVDGDRVSPNPEGSYFPTIAYYFTVDCCGMSATSLGSAIFVANDRSTTEGGFFDGIVFGFGLETSAGLDDRTIFGGSADGITLVRSSASPSGGPFTDPGFPAGLDLTQFPERVMTLNFEQGTVHGTVESLYLNNILISQVPEPACSALMAMGAFVVACALFRGRRQAGPCPSRVAN